MGKSIFFIGSFLVTGLVFFYFPQIDIWFSGFFYDPLNHFYLRDHNVCKLIYNLLEVVTIVWVIFAFFLLIVLWIRKKRFLGFTLKQIIYLLAVLAIGPGLIVNLILKDHWGRARPYSVQQFGGSLTFTPAFVISKECQSNCSFVSGHASMGFYFISFGFLFQSYRRAIIITSCFFGATTGFVRIIQGGHFLSDVVFAFFFLYAVASVLYFLIFERKLS